MSIQVGKVLGFLILMNFLNYFNGQIQSYFNVRQSSVKQVNTMSYLDPMTIGFYNTW